MSESNDPAETPSSEEQSKRPGRKPSDSKRPEKPPTSNLFWYLMIGLILAAVVFSMVEKNGTAEELKYSEFLVGLEAKSDLEGSGRFDKTNVFELKIASDYITFQDQPKENSAEKAAENAQKQEVAYYRIPSVGMDKDKTALTILLREKGIDFGFASPPSGLQTLTLYLLPMVLLILFFLFLFRKMGGAGTAMSFGRSRGKLHAQEDIDITFDDVAGIDEAVEELREIVDFLQRPEKYQALGGRIPRGVLLVGPPGTGKTLLAKAVAGEAGVGFFSLSGSDFVEMFVGVGAARVRDMFQQAGQRAPAIIFIDELDALGKVRGSGMPGGHDEREQTLNALLVEMDGFSSDQSVIVMAATNRPETLDPALMRPGRFDRHVLVDRPDIKGRESILKIHAGRVKMDDSVDMQELAKLTPGFVGADLANLANEAALLAARAGKKSVTMVEFEAAIERVIAGLEQSTRIIQQDVKLRVAYHECGHALVACSLPHTDPVHKISIIPRGMGALGYTMQRPEDDRQLVTQTELENRVCVLLGGIGAEELIYRETSTGAQNDLQRATEIARRMVTEFGMSPKLGRVHYSETRSNPFGAAGGMSGEFQHSEDTIREIDLEVRRIIDESMSGVRELLHTRVAVLEHMTKDLMEVETMDAPHLNRILDEHKTETGPQINPGTFATKATVTDTDEPKADENEPPLEAADGA